MPDENDDLDALLQPEESTSEESESDDDLEIVLNTEEALPEKTIVNQEPQKTQSYSEPKQSTDQMQEVLPMPPGSLNMNGIGTYKQRLITDFNIDLDIPERDKAWLRPGADLTDFFNYGFNEESWRIYCVKQRQLRDDFAFTKKSVFDKASHHSGGPQQSRDQPRNNRPPSRPLSRQREDDYHRDSKRYRDDRYDRRDDRRDYRR